MPSTTGLGANSRTMNGLNTLSANTISTGSLVVDNLQIDVAGTTPLIVPFTASNANIANTAFVQGAILTAAANYMDLTTNQTVATGIKTFISLPQSAAVPTLGNELVNKTFTDANYVDLTNNETIGGIKTFTNSIVATQIEGPTNSNIVVEGKGTGDVILRTGSVNRITCADNGAITIAGGSGQPMNITTTGSMTLRGASTTTINIGDNQTSGIINIGVHPTVGRTGNINLGTGGFSGHATALNWGSTFNTGALTFRGGSFTLSSSDVYTQTSGPTFNTSIDSTKTTGETLIAAGNSQTGKIDIGTGTGIKIMNLGGTATTVNLVGSSITCNTVLPTSNLTPTLGTELVTKTFTDATYVDFVNNETIGGIKTFTNAIVATQIEGPTNSNITIEGKGTGDVILRTGSANRITCTDAGVINLIGSSSMTLRSSSTTAINIGDNQTSGIINIGVHPTVGRTGAINLATGSFTGHATALNWGSTFNTGALTFMGGSFTLSSSGVYTQTSGPTFNTSIDSTKTTGETLIADGNSQTGKIDIGTGTGIKIMNLGGTATTVNLVGSSITFNTVLPTSILTPSLSSELVTKNYTDSAITSAATAYAKLASGNAFTSTNSFDSFLPTSTISATTANELVNKNTLDTAITTAATAYAKLASANAFTSTNSFDSFLPTSTLTPTLSAELVTKNFTDATYVSLTGAQSIAGIKTFTSVPECATSATTANQLTNKTFTDATYVALTGAQSIAGIKTFTSLPECSAVPSTANQLTNKNFTDATYVALTGAQSIAGIKTFTSVPECATSATTANQLTNKTFTDATYVSLTGAQSIAGIKTFTSVPECATSATTGNQLTNKTFTDATYVALTGAQSISGIKTFTSLPECSVVPSTGNQLVNKTFTDANYVDFTNTQTISGAKTFSSTVTFKNGAGAQTGTIAQDLTTLTITGVTGDVSIKPSLDFNVVTGTGKNVNISAPSTASLSSTMILTTGTTNASSYIELVTSGVQLRTKASQAALQLSGAFTTANSWKFFRDGTATAAINRMDSVNVGDECRLEVASGSNIVLTQNTTKLNSNLLLNQTTIPPTLDTQLGYSVLATATEFTFTAGVVGNMQTLALPSKGVWLVVSNISSRTTGGAGTVQNRLLCVSLANNNTTSIGTLRYFEESDDSVGSNTIRFVETITGVVTVTAATSIYVNGLFNTGSVTVLGTATSSFTRIG